MQTTFTYQRKDGGTTLCYGKLEETSNLAVVCDNENYDGTVTDNEKRSWQAVCRHLEANYNSQIEEISAV